MGLIILNCHIFLICLLLDIFFFWTDIRAEESRLDGLVVQYRRSAYAESTKSTYRSQLRIYYSFCHRFHYPPLPASTLTISRYIAFISTRISTSSIPSYINIIKLLHLEAGLPDPLQCNFHISSLIKIPSDLIKIQGDWSSDAYLRYLTSPLSSRQNLVNSLSQNILKL